MGNWYVYMKSLDSVCNVSITQQKYLIYTRAVSLRSMVVLSCAGGFILLIQMSKDEQFHGTQLRHTFELWLFYACLSLNHIWPAGGAVNNEWRKHTTQHPSIYCDKSQHMALLISDAHLKWYFNRYCYFHARNSLKNFTANTISHIYQNTKRKKCHSPCSIITVSKRKHVRLVLNNKSKFKKSERERERMKAFWAVTVEVVGKWMKWMFRYSLFFYCLSSFFSRGIFRPKL